MHIYIYTQQNNKCSPARRVRAEKHNQRGDIVVVPFEQDTRRRQHEGSREDS